MACPHDPDDPFGDAVLRGSATSDCKGFSWHCGDVTPSDVFLGLLGDGPGDGLAASLRT